MAQLDTNMAQPSAFISNSALDNDWNNDDALRELLGEFIPNNLDLCNTISAEMDSSTIDQSIPNVNMGWNLPQYYQNFQDSSFQKDVLLSDPFMSSGPIEPEVPAVILEEPSIPPNHLDITDFKFEDETMSEDASMGTFGLSNSPTKILAASNGRSLLRSNLNVNTQTYPVSGSTSSSDWAFGSPSKRPALESTSRNMSSSAINFDRIGPSLFNFDRIGPSFADEDTSRNFYLTSYGYSENEMSESDGLETSSYLYNEYRDETLVANLTPECSDVDTKIRYTSHDHTYSQRGRQPMHDYVIETPSDSSDGTDVDVESLPTDHLARTWREQFDGIRLQTGSRTRVKTLMPVNTKVTQPTSKSYGLKKPIMRKTTPKSLKSTSKASTKRNIKRKLAHLTEDQQEAKRKKHNDAERQRRTDHRSLLDTLQQLIPRELLPKGSRVSQQNLMKSAAKCLTDYKVLHEREAFDYAKTTTFEQLHAICRVKLRWQGHLQNEV